MKKIKIILTVLLVFLCADSLMAQFQKMHVNPYAGINYTSPDNSKDGFGYLAGAKFMFSSEVFDYGVDLTYNSLFSLSEDLVESEYYSVGLCVEKKFLGWIVVGAGISKYFSTLDNSTDPFGMNANFGIDTFFIPGASNRIVYRVEWINEPGQITNYSLNFELSF